MLSDFMIFFSGVDLQVFEEVRNVGAAALGGAERVSKDEPQESHSRWIVVTTIQKPTPSLQDLSRLPGWKMVVVGDRKTSITWRYDGRHDKMSDSGKNICQLYIYRHISQSGLMKLFLALSETALSGRDESSYHFSHLL